MQEIKMRHEAKSRVKDVAERAKRSLFQLEEDGAEIRDAAMRSLADKSTKSFKRQKQDVEKEIQVVYPDAIEKDRLRGKRGLLYFYTSLAIL
jgi:hypothetical protein